MEDSLTGSRSNSGIALLAVLWLAAALSAIALTIANTVRGETERSSTDADGLKTYYLASGAIDRMLLYIDQRDGFRTPDNKPIFQDNTRVVQLQFPTGIVTGEIIPETSKLSVNMATPRELSNLILALGVEPDQAQQIVAGILDWRGPTQGGSFSEWDQYYMSLTPSFRSRHASFQEIEELLLVRGVTPDLFYGSYTRDAQGQLTPRPGLRDCLSVYGSEGPFDVGTVQPAVMQAIGIPAEVASAIVVLRTATPIGSIDQLAPFKNSGPGVGRLGIERLATGRPIVTVRATAQLRLSNGQLSDLRRSVSALVKILDLYSSLYNPARPPYHVLRWYDNTVPLQ